MTSSGLSYGILHIRSTSNALPLYCISVVYCISVAHYIAASSGQIVDYFQVLLVQKLLFDTASYKNLDC